MHVFTRSCIHNQHDMSEATNKGELLGGICRCILNNVSASRCRFGVSGLPFGVPGLDYMC